MFRERFKWVCREIFFKFLKGTHLEGRVEFSLKADCGRGFETHSSSAHRSDKVRRIKFDVIFEAQKFLKKGIVHLFFRSRAAEIQPANVSDEEGISTENRPGRVRPFVIDIQERQTFLRVSRSREGL